MIKKIYTKRYNQREGNIGFLYYKLSKCLIDENIKQQTYNVNNINTKYNMKNGKRCKFKFGNINEEL